MAEERRYIRIRADALIDIDLLLYDLIATYEDNTGITMNLSNALYNIGINLSYAYNFIGEDILELDDDFKAALRELAELCKRIYDAAYAIVYGYLGMNYYQSHMLLNPAGYDPRYVENIKNYINTLISKSRFVPFFSKAVPVEPLERLDQAINLLNAVMPILFDAYQHAKSIHETIVTYVGQVYPYVMGVGKRVRALSRPKVRYIVVDAKAWRVFRWGVIKVGNAINQLMDALRDSYRVNMMIVKVINKY